MILSFTEEQTPGDKMIGRIMGWIGIRHHAPRGSFWTTFLPNYLSTVQIKRALALTQTWGSEFIALHHEYLKGTREEQYANRVLLEDAEDSLEAMYYRELFEGVLAVHVELAGGMIGSHPLLTPEQQYEYADLARHWLGYRYRGIFQRQIFGDCNLVTERAYLMLERYLSLIPAPLATEPESLL